MSKDLEVAIAEICASYGNDRTRMMDIVRAVQERNNCVSSEAMNLIANAVGSHRVEVESVVSFYAFLSKEPNGEVVIRLCDDIIDQMFGCASVGEALKSALGINFGQTTPDKKFTLEHTPCIGLCDQAPAALINNVPVTNLTAEIALSIVEKLKANPDASQLIGNLGDGNNAHQLVRSMVQNNVKKTGAVIFSDMEPGAALKKAIAFSDAEVIRELKTSRLRGRGGAGFPTGMKWDFARGATAKKKYVVCNADEGEPGTFKDRVILTERAHLMFEGMAICGYSIGSDSGIVYLRAEYEYLHAYLQSVLEDLRSKNLLGKNILGKEGFNFDIRIQLGAGAYVCGEETSLISSCEGLRGDPKNRPPFPAQKGYLGLPTNVNNVETYCSAARIIEKGAAWFVGIGSKTSPGTKLLSISGDCKNPGVYEVEFGISIDEMLEMVGAEDTQAVLVGGASGQLVPPADFSRKICFDDLGTGGAIMIYSNDRNLLDVISYFMDFFIEESCGYCTPCRVGNVLLKQGLEKIIAGNGEPSDLETLLELGETIKNTSRCGLGQTSPNPVVVAIQKFPHLFKVQESKDGFVPSFDLSKASANAAEIAGREPVCH